MIYTVTTNPNIDYYMDLRAPLHVGGINRSGRELLAPGGKGINVSLMLQTLGKPSCVLGYLAGPILEALMKDTGCDCHWFWLQSGQTRINTKINTSPETAFNASGPALGQADIDALCAFLRGLNPDDQLVVSGNLQKSPPGAFSALLSAAQEAGVSAVVDTSGAALRARRLRSVLCSSSPTARSCVSCLASRQARRRRCLPLRGRRRHWARGTCWCPWARTALCCWQKAEMFTVQRSAARSRLFPPSARATA
mgnify:CR=1 FL=1